MPNSSVGRRRWWGSFCLTSALGLLLGGVTFLEPYLKGVWFLGYWFVCFGFTAAAMVIALFDMRAIRRLSREEQRELLDETLEGVDQNLDEDSDDRKRR